MIIANKELLDDFVQSHANAVKPLNKWVEDIKAAQWTNHAELNHAEYDKIECATI